MDPRNETSAYWAQFSQDEAVRRFFPKTEQLEIDFSTMLPGRYWPAWKFPVEDATGFDYAVRKIVEATQPPKIINRKELDSKGSLCPYYAWRIFAVLATSHATTTYHDLSIQRKMDITEEIDIWRGRISSAKRLLNSNLSISEYVGSVFLKSDDLMDEISSALAQARMDAITAINQEISVDELMIKGLTRELDRIDRIAHRSANGATPDLWKMSFYVFMAAAWRHLTGAHAPALGGEFAKLLQAATNVISGGKADIEKWGQYKTARDYYRNSPTHDGFNIGENGFFSQQEKANFSGRGAESRELLEIAEEESLPAAIYILAQTAAMCRDHAEGELFTILRDMVLRNLMTHAEMLPLSLEVQLGWLAKRADHLLKADLTHAVGRAKDGDLNAVAVVEAAYLFNSQARKIIDGKGWQRGFAGHMRTDLEHHYTERLALAPIFPEMSGDLRAFEAAMRLIDNCCEFSIDYIDNDTRNILNDWWSYSTKIRI